jgi:GDP-L-fucose synthase
MEKTSKVYVAGHTGMAGSALVRRLELEGFRNLITISSRDLDLRNQADVNAFFERERPEYVLMAAAKVGGILANNTFKADFLYDNVAMESNVIHASHVAGVKKLLFLGSSCIYPKECEQPIKEDYLLTGLLEPTNEPYAIAKIMGLKMCSAYRSQFGSNFVSVMPCNLYGPNDTYDLSNGHVLASLLRKFHVAKISNAPYVELWGTGKPLREFLHVDDLATACLMVMQQYDGADHLNVGTGTDISILELAQLIKKVVGFKGEIKFDSSKPDGTFRKVLDVNKISTLGWKPTISLEEGIQSTYGDFVANFDRYTAE